MRAPLSLVVCVISAVIVWTLFFPAIMTVDSVTQYQQAASGRFDDWHPPAMAIILSAIITCGSDIGLLMLFQCTAGIIGLRVFAFEIISQLDRDERMTVAARSWAATVVTGLFLIPISPFVFYVMTFWKDAWVMILLLWIGALSFQIHRSRAENRSPIRVARYGLLVVLMGLVPHIRHNALVLMPSLCLVSLSTIRRLGLGASLLLASSPIAAFALWYPLFYWTVPIQRTYPSTQVKAIDLVGICVLDPAARADLPYTDACLAADYRASYRFGDYAPIYLKSPSIVKSEYIGGGFGPKNKNSYLDRDYEIAIRNHALTLIKVKILSFWPLLGLTNKNDEFMRNTWIAQGIAPNIFGLKPIASLEWPRRKVFNLAWRVVHSPLRWISEVHAVWLVITLIAICIALLHHRPTPTQHWSFLAVWLTVPLAYDLSFLLATPSPEYRFLYPATLNIQALTLTFIIYIIITTFARHWAGKCDPGGVEFSEGTFALDLKGQAGRVPAQIGVPGTERSFPTTPEREGGAT